MQRVALGHGGQRAGLARLARLGRAARSRAEAWILPDEERATINPG